MTELLIARWSPAIAVLVLAACTGIVTAADESDEAVAAGTGGTRTIVRPGTSTTGAGQGSTTTGGSPGAGGSSTGDMGGANGVAGDPGSGSSGSSGSSGVAGSTSGAGGGTGAGGSTGAGGKAGAGGGAGSSSGGAGGSGGGPVGTQPLKGLAWSDGAAGCADLDKLKVSWYYNWNTSTPCKVSAEYVPHVARNWGTSTSAPTPAKVAAAGYKTVLGFNEPDQAGQANMTVAQVLAAWPAFNQTTLRLGSPATSSSDAGKAWFQQFMTGVQQQGMRVDFIAIHWYGWTAGSCTPTANLLEDYIKWAEQWKKPLWLTEWSCRLQSADVTRAFYAGAIAMFKRHPLVERYAWFLARSSGEFAGAALLDASGNPTALGQDYIAAPAYH